MSVSKISSIAFIAIMLTGVYCASARAASDPPFYSVATQSSTDSMSPAHIAAGGAGVVGASSLHNGNNPSGAIGSDFGGTVRPTRINLPSADGVPGNAPPRPEYSWKTGIPFEISQVDGFTGMFTVGKPVELLVTGHSPVDIEAVPDEGFRLTATIFDRPRTAIFGFAHGEYDENKQAWVVKFTAPDDVTASYEIEMFLYCAIDESRCAEIYGRAAQTSKTLQFQVKSLYE